LDDNLVVELLHVAKRDSSTTLNRKLGVTEPLFFATWVV